MFHLVPTVLLLHFSSYGQNFERIFRNKLYHIIFKELMNLISVTFLVSSKVVDEVVEDSIGSDLSSIV